MPDVVDPATRSRMMAGIRSKNTKPEILVRQQLHARGFRYRIHCPDLPGKPDLCLRKYKAVIFVNGCFWHGHDCKLFKWPSTRPDFWRAKIGRNKAVDERSMNLLSANGWRIAVIWECAVKGTERRSIEEIMDRLSGWLKSDVDELEIRGQPICQ